MAFGPQGDTNLSQMYCMLADREVETNVLRASRDKIILVLVTAE